jgi:dihydroxyacetone kinase-like predicted kinase
MREAMETVRGVEITRAVRDSTADGHDIHEGDVIAVVDDHIAQVGGDFLSVIKAVLAAENREPELVTVYHGDVVTHDEANALVNELREAHPGTEFEVHAGGQEHYPYVLSLE